jgi:putative heme degradation protein
MDAISRRNAYGIADERGLSADKRAQLLDQMGAALHKIFAQNPIQTDSWIKKSNEAFVRPPHPEIRDSRQSLAGLLL